MSLTGITRKTLLWIRRALDKDENDRYSELLAANQIPKLYESPMGKMILAAKVESEADDSSVLVPWDFDEVCKLDQDKRCQAGHVISALTARRRRLQNPDDSSTVERTFKAFINNARATVLILDKGDLKFNEPIGRDKFLINSVPCQDWLDLSSYNVSSDVKLCSEFFYAREHIPRVDIFGSGFMISNDVVVTAAHVLEQAYIKNIRPGNLLFLRRHWAYQTLSSELGAYENQWYVLDQSELIISDQMRNGSVDGDMAWVKVKPLNESRAPRLRWNGFAEAPVITGKKVYALGHGLGIPMKLSFDGRIQNGVYHNTPSMFLCDMQILPGNSGCPIFDHDNHSLLGIISGLHKIHAKVSTEKGCANFFVNMEGNASGIATHIEPFRGLAKYDAQGEII